MGVKDYWNTQAPAGDASFAGYYDHPTLAALLNVLYPGAFPNLAAYTANVLEHSPRPRRRSAHRRAGRALPGLPEQHGDHQGGHAPAQRRDQPDRDRQGGHPRRRRR